MKKIIAVPTLTHFDGCTIAFSVSIVEADVSMDSIHTMYGGGIGYSGREIGKASAILGAINEEEVRYLAGVLYEGEWNGSTEKIVLAACFGASKVLGK